MRRLQYIELCAYIGKSLDPLTMADMITALQRGHPAALCFLGPAILGLLEQSLAIRLSDPIGLWVSRLQTFPTMAVTETFDAGKAP